MFTKILSEKLEVFYTSHASTKKTLDVGSRRGRHSASFPNVVSVDIDPAADPDIVGDAHALPFPDNSFEVVICREVLEHVENPIRAVDELYRTLKPGGKLLIYVPFLFYYHAHEGYYGDYWRFTYDTLKMFSKRFSKHEISEVRLPIETLVRLTPLGRHSLPLWLAGKLDQLIYKKRGSRQVAGYYLYLVK